MNRYNETRQVAAPVFLARRLLDQVRERIRYLHYSLRTEKKSLLGQFLRPLAWPQRHDHASARHGGLMAKKTSKNPSNRSLPSRGQQIRSK
jgi:hypothetical protein